VLSHPGVIFANIAVAVVWVVVLLLARNDASRAVASFLAASHGSVAFVGWRRR